MCGIAAAVGPKPPRLLAAVEAMCTAMFRRGPDDGGVAAFEHPSGSAVLGSRRLSIIDPSPAGHQPMHDASRGTTIAFNGMIYNYRELRSELLAQGEPFQSHCDTEVILRAYGRFGADCVNHLQGMFAFAIWDERSRQLFLARDRLGIKPLYLSQEGETLLCASTVKALLASGLIDPKLSAAGVASFLSTGSVSEPLTAIEAIRAMPAGHRGTLSEGEFALEPYWEPPSPSLYRNEDHAVAELRRLLQESVRRHLVSDAPLGVFLSGGLDSSLLAAIAARQNVDVRTISVGFGEHGFSEDQHASAVATHIGSKHTVLTLDPSTFSLWLDDAVAAMDQPSIDGMNTYAVSRAASGAGLKVAVSGLGADELFDGYGYVRRIRLLNQARSLPKPLRIVGGHLAGIALDGSMADKAKAWLLDDDVDGSPYTLLRRLFAPDEVATLLGSEDSLPRELPPPRAGSSEDLAHAVTTMDINNYLRNILLRDTDAMGMENSLEVRVPYLDDPVVSWALQAPGTLKGERKQLLKSIARDFLPEQIVSRRKQGFVLPLSRWITEDLRTDIEARLHDPPGPVEELLSGEAVVAEWTAQQNRRSHWHRSWSLYVLCRWAETVGASSKVLV